MRRSITLALGLVLAASFLPLGPASAITPGGFDCPPDDGREQITPDGLRHEFAAPQSTATGHDIAELAGAPYPALPIEMATARFPLRANLAPYTYGDLEFTLGWAGTGDFDLYVLDADGNELESSVNFNPLDGNGEKVTVPGVDHCDDLTVLVRNYAAQGGEPLTLSIVFKFPGPMFACEEEDPHPACEGKEAGEAPEPAVDSRTRLWFGGGRPGQAAMPAHYVNNTAGSTVLEESGELVKDRPLAGEVNHFTHTGQGFDDQNQNPFQANFTIGVTDVTTIQGDLHVTAWVSSQTMQGVGDNPPGTLHVDLYADSFGAVLAGTHLGRVSVPGTGIGESPTRISATFEDLDVTIEQELTVQIAAAPVATSEGVVGNPSDAHYAVYYDAVQFPSGITLDTPASAFAG